MTNDEIIKTIEFIDELNCDIREQVGDDFYGLIEFHTIGHSGVIMFCDIVVWRSENDEREIINENTDDEEYEPLGDFIKRRVNEICNNLSKIKL